MPKWPQAKSCDSRDLLGPGRVCRGGRRGVHEQRGPKLESQLAVRWAGRRCRGPHGLGSPHWDVGHVNRTHSGAEWRPGRKCQGSAPGLRPGTGQTWAQWEVSGVGHWAESHTSKTGHQPRLYAQNIPSLVWGSGSAPNASPPAAPHAPSHSCPPATFSVTNGHKPSGCKQHALAVLEISSLKSRSPGVGSFAIP